MRSRARTALVALITVGVLAVVASSVRPAPLLSALEGVDPAWVLAAALLALFFNTVQSAEAFRWMLSGFGVSIGFATALTATAGNMAIKAALPAGSGELARVAWLSRTHDVDPAPATAAVVALLWFKLVWLLLVAAVATLLWDGGSTSAGVVLAACAALSVAGTCAAPGLLRLLPPSRRSGGVVGRILERLGRALRDARPRALAMGAAHALVAVAAEMAVFGLILHAAGGAVDPLETTARVPLVIIGSKVPVTLMGMGAREGLVVLLMQGSGSGPVLLASGLLFSAVEYLLPALVGAALTWHYVRGILARSPGS